MSVEPRSSTRPVRVLLADDHAILRQSLRELLVRRPGVEVVGEVDNGVDAVNAAKRLRPDVVLMDVNMPGLNGIEATRQIRREAPGVRVLVLSAAGDSESLRQAIRAGAAGYVIKRSDVDELVLALQSVRSGNTYFSSALADKIDIADLIYEAKQPQSASAIERLTPQERKVLQLLVDGHTNRSIAIRLGISEKTVAGHRGAVMKKFAAKSFAELVALALREPLVSPSSADDDGRHFPQPPAE